MSRVKEGGMNGELGIDIDTTMYKIPNNNIYKISD